MVDVSARLRIFQGRIFQYVIFLINSFFSQEIQPITTKHYSKRVPCKIRKFFIFLSPARDRAPMIITYTRVIVIYENYIITNNNNNNIIEFRIFVIITSSQYTRIVIIYDRGIYVVRNINIIIVYNIIQGIASTAAVVAKECVQWIKNCVKQ